jgi:hypothetical protein
MVQVKVAKKVKKITYFMFCNFFSENRTIYEIMSKNVVRPDNMAPARGMLDK